jgi:hypothetical protein
MGKCVHTESLKCSDDNEDGGPTMVKGKRKVDKEFICIALWGVMLLDNVVDVLVVKNLGDWE